MCEIVEENIEESKSMLLKFQSNLDNKKIIF